MRKFLERLAFTYLGLLGLALVFAARGASDSQQNVDQILLFPSSLHWLGTDSLGRDLFARILTGGQVSVSIALISTALALLLGLLVGGLSGWKEGLADRLLMRGTDIFFSLPGFVMVSLFCLLLQSLLAIENLQLKSFIILCLAISFTHWMSFARVIRGMVMEIKRKSFVEAAHSLGATPLRIFWIHIFPNLRRRLFVLAALQIPTHMMYESYMSFIGLGVQPPSTSWGLLIQEGWKTLSAFPFLLVGPSLVLFLTVWSLNLVLDPDST